MDVKNVSAEEDRKKYNRLSEYKSRSSVSDQESRRLELLEDQKRKRENTLNAFRNATDFSFSDSENDLEVGEECMEWTDTKPKRPKLKDLFMFSEWMVKIPENLEDKWLFVMCPVGKRCLVRSAKGFTSVYGKRGFRLSKFQSALPNGSQRDYTGSRYSNSEVTILDCIWSSQTKTYYILDLLSWKGQMYLETETSFRAFWIKSKIEEMPWLLESSKKNRYPFVPLEHYPCDIRTISSVMSKYPYFPSNEPKLDGILFYHSETYYTPGITPLVVWLKPFMIPEILGIPIPTGYSEGKPLSYSDINQYIENYTKRQKLKKSRPRRGKNVNNDGDSIDSIDEEVEVEETIEEIEMLEE